MRAAGRIETKFVCDELVEKIVRKCAPDWKKTLVIVRRRTRACVCVFAPSSLSTQMTPVDARAKDAGAP